MVEKIISYLHKKNCYEKYFTTYEEYKIFEDSNNILLKLILTDENLILSTTQLLEIKNELLPFIDKYNPIELLDTTSIAEYLYDEINCLENNNVKNHYDIKYHYNIFIFRKLGYELLSKFNTIKPIDIKYIVDKNITKKEYVYFSSNFNIFIVLGGAHYSYDFIWISHNDNIQYYNNNILSLLQKRFPNIKFKIENSYSVSSLSFNPPKRNYINIYHKIEDFLKSKNIKVSKNPVVYPD